MAKKHMANIRVVQKNLAYILGLSPRLASEEVGFRAFGFPELGADHTRSRSCDSTISLDSSAQSKKSSFRDEVAALL